MRATTNTVLQLGDLLSIPVALCTATGDKEVKFETRLPDGREREQVYAPKGTLQASIETDGEGVEVELFGRDESIKGVKLGDEFREIPPSEFDRIAEDTKLDTVQVLEFIDYRVVPTDRLQGAMWVQADDGFAKPLRVLMEAMRQTKRAAVVKFGVRSRQKLGVMRVRKTDGGGDALLVNVVAFADSWRDADAKVLAPSAIEDVDDRAVAAAVLLIGELSGTGTALDDERDEMLPQMVALVERAVDGEFEREAAEPQAEPEPAVEQPDAVAQQA